MSKLRPLLLDITHRLLSNEPSQAMIDDSFGNMTMAITQISHELPHLKFKRNLKPYWNPDLQELKHLKVIAFRDWDCEGRPMHPKNVFYVWYNSAKKDFIKHLSLCSKEY